jgi:hypothetical protein
MNKQPGFSLGQVIAVAAGTMLAASAAAAVAIWFWLSPRPFQPTVLDPQEQRQLDQKLERLEAFSVPAAAGADTALHPEPYAERVEDREITFNEREINGLLANNTDLAEKLAVDFAENLVSLRLLVPLDPDFPVLGGKTLRLRAGAELAYRHGRPVIVLKGISLMGVPLPNAWLGGLKNIDLMQEFGGRPGFWQSFGEGVEDIQVREDGLHIRLRE